MEEKRLSHMCRLAMFEQIDGREDLIISNFYRRDYVGLGLIGNFILITIAFGIIVLGVVALNADYLVEHFNTLNIPLMCGFAAAAYVLVLGIYSILVFVLRRLRYNRARRNVIHFYKSLEDLADEYSEDEA